MSKTGQQTSTDVRLHVLGRVWHKHSCLATIAKVLRVMGIAEFLRKTGLEVGIITTIREDTEHGQQSTTALREYAITAELYGEGISGTSGAGLVSISLRFPSRARQAFVAGSIIMPPTAKS
ncbi:hypothetical protein LTR65_008261 [Meristemomyces frigidus]